jgi:transcriptional regulator
LGKDRSRAGGGAELLPGTLELLVLKALSLGKEHGYGIVRRIQRTSDGALLVEEGSLYPALHRMERKGWIASQWGSSAAGRRAKFYALSRDGRSQLAARARAWERDAAAVERVLAARPGEAGA